MKEGRKGRRWRTETKTQNERKKWKRRENKESVTFIGLVTPASDSWGVCSRGAVIRHADLGGVTVSQGSEKRVRSSAEV